ncbi:MAG: molybdopterin-guanine dinucleotide biosynthesis protein MobB [Spirochaetia bacterium]|nr:molybdopterin-guanine dinucleotide biosynthesis protein MobB [Spirochaetia bacterium]
MRRTIAIFLLKTYTVLYSMQYAASFVGWSNTGKTHLITQLTSLYTARGLKVGTIKRGHSPPSFETAGKDTDLFFQNGAEQVAYLSDHGGFIRFKSTPSFEQLLSAFQNCEILLIEGIMLPGIPCFELISSAEQLPETKFPKETLTAYIATAEHDGSHTGIGPTALSGNTQILPAEEPELIVKFLEEIWNAK